MQNPFFHIPLSQWLPLSSYVRISKQPLIAPFYHTVSEEPLRHIHHLYRVKNTREFEKDLDILLKDFEPVSIDDLRENRIRGKCFLLSFDDGLRQFHDLVAPILLRKGIPCICFLNNAFIDNRELFYRFKQSLLIDTLREKPHPLQPSLREIMTTDYNHRFRLDRWASDIGLDFNEYLKKERPYLTSKEVRFLAEKGFQFGGHSIDHPRYTEIPSEEQIRQTLLSSEFAKVLSGSNHSYFSFPFSDDHIPAAFFQAIRNKVDYTFGTAGLKQDCIPHHLQRIPMEATHFRPADRILTDEYAYYLLKQLFSKNYINRK